MDYPKVIIDTNIVSYVMKGHEIAKLYEKHLNGKLLAITFITVGELYYGAEKAAWGEQKRKKLIETLKNYVVIPYDYEIARHYGVVYAECDRRGKRIPWPDAWIAACALRHEVQLVTHDAGHFSEIDRLHVVTEYEKK